MEINQIIRNRRSTYPEQFEIGKKVDDAIIWQMLENANWAPTHKKTEPWRFVVFTGEGLKKLAEFQSNLYKEKNQGEAFSEKTYQMLATKPLKASHIIAIGMKRSDQVPEIEEIEAVACAVQNMYLTAAAYNIGVYWGSGGITYYPEAKSFFGLGENDKLLGFLYVGHIAKPSPDSTRKPIQEKVTWVS
ncbi:MAG: nitroreductase [Raineya sp.]|nr:nitroreductase [Raineya sp.]